MDSKKFCSGVQKALVWILFILGVVGLFSSLLDSSGAPSESLPSIILMGVALTYKKLIDIEARMNGTDCGAEKNIDDVSGVQIS